MVRTKPHIPLEDHQFIKDAWDQILCNEQFINGKYVKLFEQDFASKCSKTEFAVATNSGASALEIAIRTLPFTNKKILVPTNTFPASVSAIIRSGNIPVIVDIDEHTLCMPYDAILDHVFNNLGAIMVVHMGGLISPDMDKIRDLCNRNGLYLIEDASHAAGAQYNGTNAGAIGDVGCFSLFATKIITSGEGGMITTSDAQFAEASRIYRNHGCVRNPSKIVGTDAGVTCTLASCNYRMPELSAVLGYSQVQRLEEFITKRNAIASLYNSLLSDTKIYDRIDLPPTYPNIRQSYWQYIIKLKPDHKYNRDEICGKLHSRGIETANAYYPACHQQPAYREYIADDASYPIADDVLTRHIALPMHVELTERDVELVVSQLTDILW